MLIKKKKHKNISVANEYSNKIQKISENSVVPSVYYTLNFH